LNAFCDVKGKGSYNGFPRFWEVKDGDVANIKCASTTCELEDCCDFGPKRKCSNTNKTGLNAGGFTQADCDGTSLPWVLKDAQDLKDSPCSNKDGRVCKRRDCCYLNTESPTLSP